MISTAIKIASNLQYNRYQYGIASMVHKFFNKKAGDTTNHTVARIISEYKQLANES